MRLFIPSSSNIGCIHPVHATGIKFNHPNIHSPNIAFWHTPTKGGLKCTITYWKRTKTSKYNAACIEVALRIIGSCKAPVICSAARISVKNNGRINHQCLGFVIISSNRKFDNISFYRIVAIHFFFTFVF